MDPEKRPDEKRYDFRKQRNANTHSTLVCIVGCYIGYMAYRIVKNTMDGTSSMSMGLTILLAVVMGLVALAVIGYGVYVWNRGQKDAEMTAEEAAAVDAQIAAADAEREDAQKPVVVDADGNPLDNDSDE